MKYERLHGSVCGFTKDIVSDKPGLLSIQKIIEQFQLEEYKKRGLSSKDTKPIPNSTLYRYIREISLDSSENPTFRNARRIQALQDLVAAINQASNSFASKLVIKLVNWYHVRND